jgi:hypothetical protein
VISDQTEETFITEIDENGVPQNSYFAHGHDGTVTCVPGGGDADNDGLPDVYEGQYACLNVNVHDAAADPDADDSLNMTEYQLGSNPCILDSDGDGCADGEEEPTKPPALGGRRNPSNIHDLYDVNASKKIDASDVALVRANYNGSGPTPLEDVKYDRSLGAHPWAPNGPDNQISASDIAFVRVSFGHSCQAEPN